MKRIKLKKNSAKRTVGKVKYEPIITFMRRLEMKKGRRVFISLPKSEEGKLVALIILGLLRTNNMEPWF